ncbi:hypothetical protein KEM54_003323 [Ascosphaera aggregata]|nr:hypothetical protein KEM54_003323 [Ascosphaera aggregata]
MHTTGEPTRIVISGFPHLPGPTLLQQRVQAKSDHDNVRRRLMLGPRGHYDISTFMRDSGLVRVTVPTKETDKLDEDGNKLTVADSTRPVSFISTPAFVSGMNVNVTMPEDKIWPELIQQGRSSVTLDGEMRFDAISHAAKLLKPHLAVDEGFRQYITHPTIPDYSFLYAIMVVDEDVGLVPTGVDGAETGLCFFADHEIDRSPTGSFVTARMALAHAKGLRKTGQRWTYHSVVSNAFNGEGGFTASIVEEVDNPGAYNKTVAKGVKVRVEGMTYYTGSSSFICEDGDITSEGGFTLQSIIQA